MMLFMKKILVYFICLLIFLKFLEYGLHKSTQQQSDYLNEYGLIEVINGSPQAPKTITMYYSLACFYSRKFLQETYPELKRKYIDTGKIRLIYREFYIPTGTEWTVKLSRIGSSQDYIAFLDYAIKNKIVENSQKPNTTIIDLVLPFFESRGYKKKDVEDCLNSSSIITKVQNSAAEASNKYKIRGAPSFVYNDKVHTGLMTIQEIDNFMETGKFGN